MLLNYNTLCYIISAIHLFCGICTLLYIQKNKQSLNIGQLLAFILVITYLFGAGIVYILHKPGANIFLSLMDIVVAGGLCQETKQKRVKVLANLFVIVSVIFGIWSCKNGL